MDNRSFDIVSGSEEAKGILVETLHTKGAKKTGLQEFLEDLEETEDNQGNWWIALDQYEKPRGALTVRYINDFTYLRAIWTRVLKAEDQQTASKALLDAWLDENKEQVTKFQADLPQNSPISKSIEEVGFRKERRLMTTYKLETEWRVEELPQGYIMRPFEKDELEEVYDELVKPELDPSSPLYATKEGFKKFADRLPDSIMDAWTIVEDENGKRVGFAASFLNKMSDMGSDEITSDKAILFGPYGTEREVVESIISEMMSYWKAKGVEQIRILRVSELYPKTAEKFDLTMTNSTIRFIRKSD